MGWCIGCVFSYRRILSYHTGLPASGRCKGWGSYAIDVIRDQGNIYFLRGYVPYRIFNSFPSLFTERSVGIFWHTAAFFSAGTDLFLQMGIAGLERSWRRRFPPYDADELAGFCVY